MEGLVTEVRHVGPLLADVSATLAPLHASAGYLTHKAGRFFQPKAPVRRFPG